MSRTPVEGIEDRGQRTEDRQQGLSYSVPCPLSSVAVLPHAFFLHCGPSLASCFSVVWPVPATLISADFSALICVHCVHWAGTLASAKIASTGHSGTHASQSMQSTGSMYSRNSSW